MSLTHPMFAAGAVALALISALALHRWTGGHDAATRRFDALVGLRGYLAFLVVVHHSTIWYGYLRTGVWELPPSRLYSHFGSTSVALFFMITAFLFSSKVIDGRTRPIDWRRLYVNRVLRLVPAYLVAIGLLWTAVLAATGFALRVSPARAAIDTARWLSFTILGNPPLNRFGETPIAIAGVTWSLPYEWWFYGLLPIAALLIGARTPWLLAVASAAVTAIGVRHAYWTPATVPIAASFLGGIGAALVVRRFETPAWLRTSAAAVVCLGSAAAVTRLTTPFSAAGIAGLMIVFTIVAGGNTLFGALEWPAARVLGEMGYSVYLLHGIVLFAVFALAIGPSAAQWAPLTHWLVFYACVPLVIAVSYASYRLAEGPGMASAPTVDAWIQRRW